MAVSVGRSGLNATSRTISCASCFPSSSPRSSSLRRLVLWRVHVPAPVRSTEKEAGAEEDSNVAEGVYLYFNNGCVIASIGYIIWEVIVVANA
jgi:hypothetical protein